MANAIAPTARPLVTGSILRKVAAAMLPFYRKIAGSGSFAAQWSSAIVNADLSLMGKLLAKIPTLASVENYGTNGIGYFISFPFPLPVSFYTNGTTIPPGTVQFTFNARMHRRIAAAVLPFYRKLARSRSYAESFAAAIRRNDRTAVNKLVRRFVKASSLKSVTIEEYGAALLFKSSLSKYPYRNLMFQEVM
ncbi:MULTISPECIES: hypothetical protein [Paenibacillus]|uniref:Uncharacterized protein n=1 Tax=Paenibacillus borealis TaxID=160799 RepID=A0ABX3H2R2_PAEBO|nr:hypothetical protein [Paenibacillus borealis]OMD44708.1 hypothetical protein BSK56_21630 [Paenibacillus borealis]